MRQPRISFPGHDPLDGSSCRVVAEAGANHNNSVERAVEMAAAAAKAGAWAIKFQLYKAEAISSRNSPKYWSDEVGTATQFEAFKLSDHLEYGAYAEVAGACKEFGILFFATPFDSEAVEALERLDVSLYKVASADITNEPLLRSVGSTGKPVLLSTGASNLEEIEQAMTWLDATPTVTVPLACTLTYPTPDPDANFARIVGLREAFPSFLIGMSDHTLGTDGAWMAAALGACCIEKHYTLDTSLPNVPDHAMSVTPVQLAEMVRIAGRASLLRGSPSLEPCDSELAARTHARRSLVAARDLPAGARLTEHDLTSKRPGSGIPPAELGNLIGRLLVQDVAADQLLSWEDLRPLSGAAGE